MPTHPHDDLKGVPWYIPTLTLHLADGSTLIKPLKAIQRANAKTVAKYFALSTRTLSRLAEAGEIRSCRLTPQVTYYYPGEIEEFIKKMEENPDHWTPKRRREYGLVRAAKSTGGKGG